MIAEKSSFLPIWNADAKKYFVLSIGYQKHINAHSIIKRQNGPV
jgi:hypothetical protein